MIDEIRLKLLMLALEDPVLFIETFAKMLGIADYWEQRRELNKRDFDELSNNWGE